MILLIEGTDDTGKTNIAHAFSSKHNIPYFKCSRERDLFLKKIDFNHELQLKYDTYKFIELINQNVIKDVIIDRDYVSEFVYGYLFRNDNYNQYDMDYYIKLYDRMYFLNNLYIIIMYKPEFIDYNDDLVTKDQAKLVSERYFDFGTFTLNNVLYMDTSDHNLNKQVETIHNFVTKLDKINEYNKQFVMNSDKILFPGWFRGDKILFVGQNPGQPSLTDPRSIALHTNKIEDFNMFKLEHNISYLKSKYYKFMKRFILDLGYGPCDFSFTNIVKFSTFNNELPSDIDINEQIDILIKQIEIFKPVHIVSFGKLAHIMLRKYHIVHEPYYHPSRYYYVKTEKIYE